jgi:hypothetical protein
MNCYCCDNPAKVTIELAGGINGKASNMTKRWYIPNDSVRTNRDMHGDVVEVPFCLACMRVIEDNLRATILYLQAENAQVQVSQA